MNRNNPRRAISDIVSATRQTVTQIKKTNTNSVTEEEFTKKALLLSKYKSSGIHDLNSRPINSLI